LAGQGISNEKGKKGVIATPTLDIGYSLLAVGYSKRGEYHERVLTSFKEDN
jgi:hypothetical protein